MSQKKHQLTRIGFLIIILLTLMPVWRSYAQKGISLASNGKARVAIVLPEKPTDVQKFAGTELAKYLKQLSGADFNANQKAAGASIRLEHKPASHEEQYAISTRGRDIILTGASDRALLYAVYDFLGRLGCQWLAPELNFYKGHAEYIPKQPNLTYSFSGPITEVPKFAFRKIYVEEGLSHDEQNLKEIIAWMPKARYNALVIPTDYGGTGRVQWDKWRIALTPELKKRGILIEVGGHGYENFLNAKMEGGTLFKKHPEWFGKNKNCEPDSSKKLVFNTANPEAVKYFIGNITKYLKAHPEVDIFDFWPPDGARWAECPELAALGTPQDRQALLANQVQDAIKKIRPDLRLEIIAYADAKNPPETVTLHPDILVDFCPISQNFEVQIYDTTARTNNIYVNSINAWRQQFKGDIGLYSYYRKYAWRSMPVVFPHFIQRDMKWYEKVPLQGISTYAEPGDWYTYELNHYLLGHLGWNQAANIDALAQKYYQVRYGSVAQVAEAAYKDLEKLTAVYGSIPGSSLKSAEATKQAQQKIAGHISALNKAQQRVSDAAVSANLNRLLLMLKYLNSDLKIQQSRAANASKEELLTQIKEQVAFLEENHDKGVFILHGSNILARFTKKYGLTNQSLLE